MDTLNPCCFIFPCCVLLIFSLHSPLCICLEMMKMDDRQYISSTEVAIRSNSKLVLDATAHFAKEQRWKQKSQHPPSPFLLYHNRQKLGDSCWPLGISLFSGPDFSTRRQSTPAYLEGNVLETLHNLLAIGRSHRGRRAPFFFPVILSTCLAVLSQLFCTGLQAWKRGFQSYRE